MRVLFVCNKQKKPPLLKGSRRRKRPEGFLPQGRPHGRAQRDDWRLRRAPKQIVAAAKKTRCDDFITALPDGYNTVIGEGGASLSGGEKQRISIAHRAMDLLTD